MDAIERFKCPECGDNRLEEVTVNVTQYTEIVDVWVEGEDNEAGEALSVVVDYGDSTTDGGETVQYQCLRCGWVLPGVTTDTELYRYLKALPKPASK